jgi:hypothetical protein
MKTTIDIAEPLLEEAKLAAARQRTTLRDLVEQGLRLVLTDCRRAGAFQLRDASFRGEGLQPGVDEGAWDKIRELAYEGRGG